MVIVGGDLPGGGFYLSGCISHGYAVTGGPQHVHIVVVIPKGDCILWRNPQFFTETVDSSGFGGSAVHDLQKMRRGFVNGTLGKLFFQPDGSVIQKAAGTKAEKLMDRRVGS